MLLRVILPAPLDDDRSTIAPDEEANDDTQKLVEQMSTVDTRMESLQTEFGAMKNRMEGLESKLDQILVLLGSLGNNSGGIATSGGFAVGPPDVTLAPFPAK